MRYLFALLAGALFGAGLIVSGMSNPRKVLDFLDLAAIPAGRWDPTLLAVFAGALPVMFVAYRLVGAKPWAAERFDLPAANGVIDTPLVLGSSLFGVGWGLAGLCPGPAVVALAVASSGTLPAIMTFAGALLLGVWLATLLRGFWTRKRDEVPV
jgi:uncharacterized protein